jgi:hypothetical protein
MTIDVRQATAGWRAMHARRAWKPVCDDVATGAAHFGGSPMLGAGEPWPTCAGCAAPMQFFVQVDLAALPAGSPARGTGLLQLFYCSIDDGGCETWAPFSGTHLVRLLTGPAQPAAHPPSISPFPRRRIAGWNESLDHPHPPEHEELGLSYQYDFDASRVHITCAEVGLDLPDADLDAAETIATALPGDKLGGWPAWVQGVEYPSCPACSAPMELVLQLDSEDNVPHMFGDVGCGHVTQCPAHPHVLAFGWACS